MGTQAPGFVSSQHIDTGPLEQAGEPFEFVLSIAGYCNAALDAWRASDDRADLAEWKARRAQYQMEVNRWRELGQQVGTRAAFGLVDIVSYLDADGRPDTSTAESEAYWDDVAEAAELGVPNVFGTQR